MSEKTDWWVVRDRANALAARVDTTAFPGDDEALETELNAALSRIHQEAEES